MNGDPGKRTSKDRIYRVERFMGKLGWQTWSWHRSRWAAASEARTARAERGGKFRQFRVVTP